MASDIHTEWAYGHSINLKAAFLALFGAVTFISQLCGLFGAINHNKPVGTKRCPRWIRRSRIPSIIHLLLSSHRFCLLVFWISMVINQILQASLASSIQAQIATEFSEELQLRCLKGTEFVRWETGAPDFYTRGTNTPECDAFLNSDATLKLQVMWYNMYRMSLDEDTHVFRNRTHTDGEGYCRVLMLSASLCGGA